MHLYYSLVKYYLQSFNIKIDIALNLSNKALNFVCNNLDAATVHQLCPVTIGLPFKTPSFPGLAGLDNLWTFVLSLVPFQGILGPTHVFIAFPENKIWIFI